eukprot:jgi/Hompol1/5528/HPOL_004500-RA
MESLNKLIASGEHRGVLAVLKGFRNGAVYGMHSPINSSLAVAAPARAPAPVAGAVATLLAAAKPHPTCPASAKIRFPHALVMTFLFRRTNLKDMARQILKLTYQHSRNLAYFVTIYKTLMLLQARVKGFEHNADSLIAGIIGGYLVFGENTPVNNQIVLYLFSRISVGLAQLAVKRGIVPQPKHAFPVFAAVTWGIVMWLFRHDRDTLQPSLQSSMQYLYNDSDSQKTKAHGKAMGINGLIPLLKSIHRNVHLRDYAGQSIGIDAYVWLHKGVFSCAFELCQGIPTTRLPIKRRTEEDRHKRRDEAKARGFEFLRNNQKAQATECFQTCVDVTPQMAYELIKALRRENIEYIVAPYEADAQLAYLSRIGDISAIITEDSDLLVFGFTRVIFKLDHQGAGIEIRKQDLVNIKEMRDWSEEKFRHMCILSGCDYLESPQGIGIKKSLSLLSRSSAPTLIKTWKAWGKAVGSPKLPKDYYNLFMLADFAFKHQRVYDPQSGCLVPLTPFPEGLALTDELSNLIGPDMPPELALAIAIGDVDPITKVPFETQTASGSTTAVSMPSYPLPPKRPLSGLSQHDGSENAHRMPQTARSGVLTERDLNQMPPVESRLSTSTSPKNAAKRSSPDYKKPRPLDQRASSPLCPEITSQHWSTHASSTVSTKHAQRLNSTPSSSSQSSQIYARSTPLNAYRLTLRPSIPTQPSSSSPSSQSPSVAQAASAVEPAAPSTLCRTNGLFLDQNSNTAQSPSSKDKMCAPQKSTEVRSPSRALKSVSGNTVSGTGSTLAVSHVAGSGNTSHTRLLKTSTQHSQAYPQMVTTTASTSKFFSSSSTSLNESATLLTSSKSVSLTTARSRFSKHAGQSSLLAPFRLAAANKQLASATPSVSLPKAVASDLEDGKKSDLLPSTNLDSHTDIAKEPSSSENADRSLNNDNPEGGKDAEHTERGKIDKDASATITKSCTDNVKPLVLNRGSFSISGFRYSATSSGSIATDAASAAPVTVRRRLGLGRLFSTPWPSRAGSNDSSEK